MPIEVEKNEWPYRKEFLNSIYLAILGFQKNAKASLKPLGQTLRRSGFDDLARENINETDVHALISGHEESLLVLHQSRGDLTLKVSLASGLGRGGIEDSVFGICALRLNREPLKSFRFGRFDNLVPLQKEIVSRLGLFGLCVERHEKS